MTGQALVQKLVGLPPSTWADLTAEAHRHGISRAELIRRKLGVYGPYVADENPLE